MFKIFTKIADFITGSILSIEQGSHLYEAVHFFIEDITKIFFLLCLIIFIISYFRSSLSPERVRKMLGGKNKAISYLMAVILGAISPFCSCSTVPLFIGFLEAGIPLGITMAFLIASPMINEVAVVVLSTTIGLKFTILYIATGLIVGIVGGLLIELFKMEKYVEEYVWKMHMGELSDDATLPETPKEKLSYAKSQVKEIVQKIWIYLIIGIGAGAALHGYVPVEFFEKYTGANNLLSVPIAVIIGIPVYSNATGVIPIIEALLAKGVPVGSALAFMMSVAAISLPEMIILRKVLKPKLIATFIGILFVCFIMVGYLFNFII